MLRQKDVGRPISELASKLQHEDLGADCRNVLKTLVFMETEVSTSDGGIYLMRIMPYRTATNAIDGLVLTFVDISRLKQSPDRSSAYVGGLPGGRGPGHYRRPGVSHSRFE